MKWAHDFIRVERGAHSLLSRKLNEAGKDDWQVSAIINNDSDMIAYIQKFLPEPTEWHEFY
jgi:hypothetical protein